MPRSRSEKARAYHRAYYREYYRNRPDQRAKAAANFKARADKHRKRMDEIRRAAGCIDCGTREGLLHFDHRPDEIKLFTIGDVAGRKWEVLEAEIAKCDVRCHSCHSKRHNRLRLGTRASDGRREKHKALAAQRQRDARGRFLTEAS